tara:strand:+ start:317 stop:1186 length:870 start_codon:yes stop_codon:yes gene_type:complete
MEVCHSSPCTPPLYTIAASNTFVVCGGQEGVLHVFDVASQRKIVALQCQDVIGATDFSPDQKHLAIGTNDGWLQVHNMGQLGTSVVEHKFCTSILRAKFFDNFNVIVSLGDATLVIVPFLGDPKFLQMDNVVRAIHTFEQELLACGSDDFNIYTFCRNEETHALVTYECFRDVHKGWVMDIAQNHTTMVSASMDHTVCVFAKVPTTNSYVFTKRLELQMECSSIVLFNWLPGTFVCGTFGGALYLYTRNKLQEQLRIHQDWIQGVAKVDSKTCATCSSDGLMQLISILK